MPASAGHNATWMFLWEDDGFAEEPVDDVHKPFGADVNVGTAEGSHNAVRLTEPNSREAAQIIEQNFEGSFSVDWTLTNPWWVAAVIAEPTSNGSSAPYDHSFDGNVPLSMRIINGTTTTGVERYLEGCVVTNCSITVDTMETVSVSFEGIYANEEKDPNDSLAEQPTIDERGMHFGQAALEIDDDTIAYLQSIDLTIANNTDLIHEIGSRFPVDYSPKLREIDLSWTDIVNDEHDHLDRFYGEGNTVGSTIEVDEDAKLVFDNGETGEDKNSLVFDIGDLFPDSYSRDAIADPTEDLTGNVSAIGATVSATAENGASEAL